MGHENLFSNLSLRLLSRLSSRSLILCATVCLQETASSAKARRNRCKILIYERFQTRPIT